MNCTSTLTAVLVCVLFPIYSAFWRRWFGGGAPSYIMKIPSAVRRFLFNAVNIAAMFSMFFFFREIPWKWSLYAALVVQIIYWNYTFGMYMDVGRDYPPTEQSISDYNEDPMHNLMDAIFVEKRRYGEYYDFFGMMWRFSWPMLFVFFVPTFNIGLLLLGPLVALCYEMWWNLRERGIGQSSRYIRDINEYGAGFVTGLFLVLV